MSEIVKTVTKIHIRYFLLDEDGEEMDSKWLFGSERLGKYTYRCYGDGMRLGAYDWVERYGGDIPKAMSYAGRLAKIVKCGKKLLNRDWDWELVMVRDITRRTETSITNNAMAVLAVAALD